MSRNFYFGKDADIVTGSANFASLIATGFASYGLSSAQSTAFGLLNTALQSAYTASVNPSTRTPVTVEASRTAIKNMRANATLLAKIVYSTATVTDSQLVALGLLPRSSRAPVPPPAIAPVIDVVSVNGNSVRIRLHAPDDSKRRGKPAGCDGLVVFSYVGAAAPNVESEWTNEGVTSKTVVDIAFPPATPGGSKVWFTGFYFNARKQNGPAAAPVSTNIAGGGAMAA
ncbi:MAG TPA: hypothetical protein VHS31_10220 [Tepidisphaeraceae bacterium]|jgi:hypothetical protein|nr:hypothetical protein [Tepidisphaeraceae bacterium]